MPHSRPAAVGALAIFTLLAALPRFAAAYEISTSSAGDPLRWLGPSIEVGLDFTGGPGAIPAAQAEHAAARAFRPWTARLAPVLELDIGRAAGAGHAAGPGDRQSGVRWILADWERDFAPTALAVTLVTYRARSGEIVEADIAVNGQEYAWSASETTPEDCYGVYDLQNVLTHEAGHFFGLGHAGDDREATMYPRSADCETGKRSLAADDVNGLTALYDGAAPEPGEPTEPGNDPPAEELLAYGCSAAPAGSPARGAGACALLFGSILLWRRRAAVLVAVAALSLPLGVARASVARALPLDELATRAVAVVRAEVIAQRTRRLRGVIYTDSTVRVTECWKGPCPGETVVRQLGGEHLGLGMRVTGQAPLGPGDRVVLFLRERRDGTSASLGMAQGVFFEVPGPGGEISLERDLTGLTLVARDGRRAASGKTLGLAALRREVTRKLSE